ncbi:MAG: hypothetical protein U5L02_09295 [Rheinheimera sp.]|nr:hypothetical protein [Rheinheimera sp.]
MAVIRTMLVIFFACLVSSSALAVDTASLWDFNNPELSERRFQSALKTAKGDDVLIIQTQIARTYMLRKDFGKARQLLYSLEPQVESTGAGAQVRYWLELGRSYASHQHPVEPANA